MHRSLTLLAAPLLAASSYAQTIPMGFFQGSDSGDDDQFGLVVDCSGTQAIVGAEIHGGAGVLAGAAYVYEWGGAWAQVAKLQSSDIAVQDFLGSDVGITAGRAIVGARGDDDGGSNSGSAYIFEQQPDGTWQEAAKLTASAPNPGADFGHAVDIDGDVAVVGAPDAGFGLTFTGHAYVFERQGDGSWSEVALLIPSDASSNDDFGWSVAVDGGRVVVGATLDDDGGGASGSGYVFERQPGGAWIEADKLVASDADAGDQLGWSVDIDGDTAVLGSWLNPVTALTGAVYAFVRQPDGSWVEQDVMVPPGGSIGGKFGQTVAVSGDLIAVGAHERIVDFQIEAGEVFLFVRDLGGAWNHAQTIDKDPEESDEHFGVSVALDGGLMVVGAFGVDATEDDDDQGAAFPFFSFDGTGFQPPIQQGTGTPGCDGAQTMGVNLPPAVGATEFAFTCDNAPPSSTGFLTVGPLADVAGSDPFGLGFLLHVDPAGSPLVLFGFASDADGNAEFGLPIPDLPILLGATWHAQSVWSWTSCSLPPAGFSSSNLISFTFLQL